MYEVKVISDFSGAHQLKEIGGKCEQLHGHNWKVEVFLRGEELDAQGMLIDFSVVKGYLKQILSNLDHKYLNALDFFQEKNPSSENIAVHIFNALKEKIERTRVKVFRVDVWESDNTCASYVDE